MALSYSEFDTTQANLLADIRTAILASTDWSRPNSGSKPDTYKATTTRGAQMVFDLSDAAIALNVMQIGVYTSYDGTTFGDKTTRYLYWRGSTSSFTSANPLHVVVSAGKEHIFISVEGPRAGETGATSATVGSAKNYFFMSDIVPYHASDPVAVVFAGGQMAASATGSINNNSHQGATSRNYANNASWGASRLMSMDFPSVSSTETIQTVRVAAGDGKYYLFPYVVFSDENGIRGRLSSFFLAGYTFADNAEISAPTVGSKITYNGDTYKLLAVSKGDSSVSCWGQFGSATNASNNAYKSVVVAVPCTP